MGPRFRVSSERLEKPWIEPTTPVLEGEQLNHYATEASFNSLTGGFNSMSSKLYGSSVTKSSPFGVSNHLKDSGKI